jgi:hypothetical protein
MSAAQEAIFKDEMFNPDFVTVDVEMCLRLIALFDSDTDINTFARAAMNHALAGGIVFTRRNRKLQQKDSDWHSHVWSDWVRDVHKYLFAVGFCFVSSVPDREYGAKPTVLCFDKLDIRYKIDVQGQTTFRVFEKLSMMDTILTDGEGIWNRRPLNNIRVIQISPPTCDGTIRSQLLTLLGDLMYEQHLLQVSFHADRARARPPIVTQHIQQPYKAEQNLAVAPTAYALSRSAPVRYGNGSSPAADSGLGTVVELMNRYGFTPQDMTQSMSKQLAPRINNSAIDQVYLATGRELVTQVMPEAPHDILLGFRMARMVTVGLAFGMTLPALTHNPSNNIGSSVKKTGSNGKDDDGSSSVYFENFQRELKQRLIIYIHQHYMHLHSASFAIETLAKNPKMTAKQVREDVDVQVALPGQPNEELLHRLYTEGMLKYDAYVSYVSSKHCIPTECFETSAKVSVKELNGIQPQLPGASSSSKSSKK